jgi:exodeoxyribonuclease VII large subunit
LRERLAAEGLFDPGRKRPLPRFPRRIAVVTSPSGAALHDFLQVARRRWAIAQLLIIPTSVQGSQAAGEIVAAIGRANSLCPAPDVVVVTRGGGSMEDLWCFNEETVVRAIYGSAVPVVSAIGHEIDVTLADLVADCRALTPSEAAERVIPSADEWRSRLEQSALRLQALSRNQLHHLRSRLTSLATRPVLARPLDRLRERAERLDELERRLHLSMQFRVSQSRERTEAAAARIEGLSPLAVLARGFSVTTLAGTTIPVRRASELHGGDRIDTRLAEGIVSSIVESRREG